jgi:formate hydrogenlyase subunit 3/multisubunit Na+/H+ antiporter MnhD subunit
MQIRYTNTRWDLFKGQMILTLSNKFLLGFFGLMGVVIVYGVLSGTKIQEESATMKALLAMFQLVFSYGLIFLLLAAFLLIQIFFQKLKGALGEHTLRITDDGLEEKTDYNVSLHRWPGFVGCKRRAGLWIIYLTETMAHIVPAQRPLAEGDLESFIQEIEKRIAQAAVRK